MNAVSVVAFGAPVPKSLGGLALSCLLAIGGLFALGLLVAAVALTAGGVNAIGRLALIPLMFFAGLWLPRAIMPTVLQDISNYTPLGAAVEAIQDSVQTGFPRPRHCWSWLGTPWSSPSSRAVSSAGNYRQGAQAGAAPARVVILGRGVFASVSNRSTDPGRSA